MAPHKNIKNLFSFIFCPFQAVWTIYIPRYTPEKRATKKLFCIGIKCYLLLWPPLRTAPPTGEAAKLIYDVTQIASYSQWFLMHVEFSLELHTPAICFQIAQEIAFVFFQKETLFVSLWRRKKNVLFDWTSVEWFFKWSEGSCFKIQVNSYWIYIHLPLGSGVLFWNNKSIDVGFKFISN
jgi:hypothetical protein